MILDEEGLPQVWRRHESLAGAVWAAFLAWGATTSAIGLNMANPNARGRSVTAARIGGGGAGRCGSGWKPRPELRLGFGLGMAPPTAAGLPRISAGGAHGARQCPYGAGGSGKHGGRHAGALASRMARAPSRPRPPRSSEDGG